MPRKIHEMEAMVLISMEMVLVEMTMKAPRMMNFGHQAAFLNQAFHAWIGTCIGLNIKEKRMFSLTNKYYQLCAE